MKNKIIKIVSMICAMTMICTCTAVMAFNAGTKNVTENKTEDTKETDADSGLSLNKDETVYVLANTDGSVKKVIVSDWIKNGLNESQLQDASELENVNNVKGDESYTMNKDNMRVWDAQGNDIYYQGEINKELPVDLAITYKLDGKTVTADEICGKSGKVTIRFDYTNNQYETVSIDGKPEKIYVPFAMLTGMILDNEKFTNVEVSNGKLINDGDHSVVIGLALPGVQENLDISKDTLEIPDYVEITADAKDFELNTTMTLATNEMFNELDVDGIDSLDELEDSMTKLTDSMSQLIDGSSQLYNGLTTLFEKSGQLIDGIDTLASGAKDIYDGAKKLSDGAKTAESGASKLNDGVAALAGYTADASDGIDKLSEGLGTLSTGASKLDKGTNDIYEGLATIDSNSEDIRTGAKSVFENLLATGDTSIAAAGITAPKLTIDNYDATLSGIISSLSDDKIEKMSYATALSTVTTTVESNRTAIEQQVTAAVRKNVYSSIVAKMNMTVAQYEQAVENNLISAAEQEQVTASIETAMNTEQVLAQIKTNTDAKLQSLIAENMKSDEVTAQINDGVNKAKAGVENLKAFKAQMANYNKFYQGILAYTAGVEEAKYGAKDLSDGASQLSDGLSTAAEKTIILNEGMTQIAAGTVTLKDGMSELYSGSVTLSTGAVSLTGYVGQLFDGILTLQDKSGALIDGVTQLKDGSVTLKDGLNEFNEKGIQKLADAFNGDIKTLITRAKATIDVSKDYKSFSGISDEMDGNVKFIYKTDSIKAE